ncbi:MAG: hypothetical protein F6J93_33575 [Oscillatoria sp. SIO1A7]|nr:hypothetical protein [Oscillatoria sp. SIO1A7]
MTYYLETFDLRVALYIRLDAIAPERLRGENRSPINMVRYSTTQSTRLTFINARSLVSSYF